MGTGVAARIRSIVCPARSRIRPLGSWLWIASSVTSAGAAAVLMICRLRPNRIYREIDWTLLLMFIGLFIVVHAFQLHVVDHWGVQHWSFLLHHPIGLLSGVSAALSNLVSNVPAVLLFEPVMRAVWAHAAPKTVLAPPSPEAKRMLSCMSVDPESGEAQRGGITECFRIDARGRIIDTQSKLISRARASVRHHDDDEHPARRVSRARDDDERPRVRRSNEAQWQWGWGGGWGWYQPQWRRW